MIGLDRMYIPLELLKYRYSTCLEQDHGLMNGSAASLAEVTVEYDTV